MATSAEIKAQAAAAREAAKTATQEAERLAAEARKVEREEIAERERNAYALSSDRAFASAQDFTAITEKQHAVLYAKAYELGHSSGYTEVEYYYGELLELIVQFKDAA